MKKNLLFLFLFLFVGCGIKEPIKLDNSNKTTINQGLIKSHYSKVPIDPYLNKYNWQYTLFKIYNPNKIINNNEKIKFFYLAQNANRIKIIADTAEIGDEYKNFMINNGVSATISYSTWSNNSNENKNLVEFIFIKDNVKNR